MSKSKFDEMRAAAFEARIDWLDRSERTRRFIDSLLTRFMDYCKMPYSQLRVLRLNLARDVFELPEDEILGFPQATHYNEEKDEWSIGVQITLTLEQEVPELVVGFGLFIKEDEGRFSVRIGHGKEQRVDLNVQPSYEPFFESLISTITDSFKDPKKSKSSGIGFSGLMA